MKKLVLFAVLPLLILAGCTTQYKAQAPNDDVYYSSRDVPVSSSSKVVVKQSQVPVTSDYSTVNPQENVPEGNQQAEDQSAYTSQYSGYDNQPTESYSEPGGDTYINNNYYDDYYDYAYASRLRRFHDNSYFNSYYNDYYTNMYWYDYNPWSWGTSIYYNSGWFGPSFGLSFGWGWPSYSYGWGGYPSYGGYYNGYNDGYFNGYYDGYYAGSYNNGWYNNNEGGWYDNNSYYYGHRGQSGFAGSSSNGRNLTGTNGQSQGRSVNPISDLSTDINGRTVANRSDNQSITTGRSDNSSNVTPANGRNIDASGNRIQQNAQGRTTQGATTSTATPRPNPGFKQNTQAGRGRYVAPSQYRQGISNPGRSSQNGQAQPQSRYSTPQQQNNTRTNVNAQPKGNVYRDNAPRQAAQPARTYTQPGTRIQSYSSPSYSKPRSSQEYTTPKYRDMRNNGNNSQPQQRSGSSPNNRDNGAVRENAPRSSSSQPSQSQPSRSTNSAPNRSNDNSYSTPSRSSSGSSSSDNSSRSNSSGSSGSSSSGSSRSSSSSSGSGNGRR